MAGVGQTTASGMASQAGQLGANLGNLYYGAGTAAGQARASGYLGMGNALTSAIGTGLNYYQGQQLLNRMYPPPGAGAGTGTGVGAGAPFSVGP